MTDLSLFPIAKLKVCQSEPMHERLETRSCSVAEAVSRDISFPEQPFDKSLGMPKCTHVIEGDRFLLLGSGHCTQYIVPSERTVSLHSQRF